MRLVKKSTQIIVATSEVAVYKAMRTANKSRVQKCVEQYRAEFIGYSAEIVERDGDFVCAHLDFVTGRVTGGPWFARPRSSAQFKDVLEQAKRIGERIIRRPYSEYIDEIAQTGLARIVAYGFALYVDEKLEFHPRRKTMLVQMNGRTARITEIDEHESDLTSLY
jgi:hypothetical protein